MAAKETTWRDFDGFVHAVREDDLDAPRLVELSLLRGRVQVLRTAGQLDISTGTSQFATNHVYSILITVSGAEFTIRREDFHEALRSVGPGSRDWLLRVTLFKGTPLELIIEAPR